MKMSWSLFVELIFWARRLSFVKSNSQRQQTPNPLAQVPDLTPPCLRQSCKDLKISTSLSSPPQPSTSASFKLGCSKKQNIKSGKAKHFCCCCQSPTTRCDLKTQIKKNHLCRETGSIVSRKWGAGVVFEGDNGEEGKDWWKKISACFPQHSTHIFSPGPGD